MSKWINNWLAALTFLLIYIFGDSFWVHLTCVLTVQFNSRSLTRGKKQVFPDTTSIFINLFVILQKFKIVKLQAEWWGEGEGDKATTCENISSRTVLWRWQKVEIWVWRVSDTATEEKPSKLPQVVLVARHVDRPWQVGRSTWQSQCCCRKWV